MMGVCDGHGVQGHLVSNYVKTNMPKILNETILSQMSPNRFGDEMLRDDANLSSNNKAKKSDKSNFLPPLIKNGRNYSNF